MGPHIYEGRFLNGYGFTVCNTCYGGNWDGWSPTYDAAIEAHLEASGKVPPLRNTKGWYPRDWPST